MSAVQATSPRTPERPMAFTNAELRRGALWTWLTFVILLALLFVMLALRTALIAAPVQGSLTGIDAEASRASVGAALWGAILTVIVVTMIGGTVSGLMTLMVRPLAGRLGTRMAGVRPFWKHLLAHGLLGAVAGAVTGAALTALLFSSALATALPTILFVALIASALTGVAAATGWAITARHALRDDARRTALDP
ncbi:MAG: hypothetical protein JSS74_01380 [Actinobacteria bacterium]|nr:hypothetical protein [Actinomycetota bacterium]